GARTRLQMVAQLERAGTEALGEGAGIRLTARQRQVLWALAAGPMPTAELRAAHGADLGVVRRLAARGLVTLEQRPLSRRPADVEIGAGGRARARRASGESLRGQRRLTP